MKKEALVMTIDFGKNHFNAIHLNDQLKLIASDGRMITVNDTDSRTHQESADLRSNSFDFSSIDNIVYIANDERDSNRANVIKV